MRLDQIRRCLEGWIPSTLATCDAQGVPNITYVSQVQFVDLQHVALTFQFFNKTRANILQNPQATLLVIDPQTAAQYRLALVYRRTEESGPLFESMKAKLAGIASSSGMEKVFHLRGADIYQVVHIEAVPCVILPAAVEPRDNLLAVRQLVRQLDQALCLEELVELLLTGLKEHLGIESSLLLLADEQGQKLFTIASRGYPESGAGSEVPFGVGVAGTAALYRTAIRIGHAAAEYGYLRAMQDYVRTRGEDTQLETQIPVPGLHQTHSQLALPLLAGNKLLGVIFVESERDEYFNFEHEDALGLIASYCARLMEVLRPGLEEDAEANLAEASGSPAAQGQPLQLRYFAQNHSLFVGEDYLIKGVAGLILWRLLQIYTQEGRTRFSNRELRLDRSLKLPDVDDNLEARLILLRRRLAERCAAISLERAGRGTFTLNITQPLELLAN